MILYKVKYYIHEWRIGSGSWYQIQKFLSNFYLLVPVSLKQAAFSQMYCHDRFLADLSAFIYLRNS